jgi:hypothetical protein
MRYRALSPIYIFLICRFSNSATGVKKSTLQAPLLMKEILVLRINRNFLKNSKLFNWTFRKRTVSQIWKLNVFMTSIVTKPLITFMTLEQQNDVTVWFHTIPST